MAYTGFKKLKGQLAQQSGVTNPGGLAAAIGRRKYGGKAMAQAAATGKSLRYKGKRKPGEVSDVRSENPGTKGVEGAKRYRSKGGYQIPYSQDTKRNPYKRGSRA